MTGSGVDVHDYEIGLVDDMVDSGSVLKDVGVFWRDMQSEELFFTAKNRVVDILPSSRCVR